MNIEQYERIRTGQGFVAALDQSGGSTPKALCLYGLNESHYANEAQMFQLIHQMRSRIMTSPVFNSNRILAAILFEMTMEQKVDGLPSAEYLWHRKGIVPFLKVDNGLLPQANGVQLMKPIPELSSRLEKANSYGIFGTKERSIIKESNATGISACVDQQFEVAEQVLEADLIPIIEPEVDINACEKDWIEHILKRTLLEALNSLEGSQNVMLKLTIPTHTNFYQDLTHHPRVLRVVDLSGGYPRSRACELLAKNDGLIASFSRALTEGLTAQQSESEFDDTLDRSIQEIFEASAKIPVHH